MAKIQFSDVTPPERRSIRDVPIPNSGKRKITINVKPDVIKPTPKVETRVEPQNFSTVPELKNGKAYEYYYPKDQKVVEESFRDGKKSFNKRFLFGGLALIAVTIFIVSMMTAFASATIVIKPKQQEVAVSMNITGTLDSDPSAVKYEVIKVSKTSTVSVPATSEESVELEARGKIVIYNNFSFEPQRLIVRTRFESPDGLVYRIPESIIVPGKSVKDGVTVPGSIEVEVFADEAGEKYNIKKTDFTIPGFKNDAERYKNFYARSLSDMTGGFVGKMKTVSAAEKSAALKTLETEAQSFLADDLKTKISEEMVLLSNSIIYDSKELPQSEDSSGVVLSTEVTAYAILFNSQNLSEKIINQYINNYSDWENIKASVRDFSTLNITKKPTKLEAGVKIDIEISGNVKFLAEIDTDLITQRLVGMGRKEAGKLTEEFPGISGVTTTIRPMWKRTFPENPSKISVKTAWVE